jgi:hypothetical protein
MLEIPSLRTLKRQAELDVETEIKALLGLGSAKRLRGLSPGWGTSS